MAWLYIWLRVCALRTAHSEQRTQNSALRTAPAIRHLARWDCPIFNGWRGGFGRVAAHRTHGLAPGQLSHEQPDTVGEITQGGKSRLYFALWLSKEGQGS